MFGTRRSTQQFRPEIRDRGHNAGMDRDGRGVPPLVGGIVGTIVQNFVARKVARKIGMRAGGVPGLIAGAAITYAFNRFFKPRPSRRFF